MQKKYLHFFISLLVLILIVMGYTLMMNSSKTTTPEKETEETKTPSVDEPSKEEEKTSNTYSDEVLGLSFYFPAAWGTIIVNEEEGFTESADQEALPVDENGQFLFDGIVNRSLSFSQAEKNAPTVFLVAHNPSVSSLGRGGYWGDQAGQLTSAKGLQQWCQTTLPDYINSRCTLSENAQGILIGHKHSDEKSFYGNTTSNIDEYGIYHADHTFSGIILSTEAIGSLYADSLQKIVDSLSFKEL